MDGHFFGLKILYKDRVNMNMNSSNFFGIKYQFRFILLIDHIQKLRFFLPILEYYNVIDIILQIRYQIHWPKKIQYQIFRQKQIHFLIDILSKKKINII